MDSRLNSISLRWGVPGVILQLFGGLFFGSSLVGALVRLVGTIMLLIGLGYYAKAKGRSPLWGLMGFLSLLGILILALLPDKNRVPYDEQDW